MKQRFLLILVLAIQALLTTTRAEGISTPTLSYYAETNVITGLGEYTPFYLANIRQGMVSLDPNNGYLTLGVSKEIDTSSEWSYAFGLQGIAAYNNYNPLYLQQAYVDVKFRVFQLSIGSKEEYSILQDRYLSSGSMLWSGNARPIPQVRVGIPRYYTIPRTNEWLHIKGEVAYGIYVDNTYQAETYTYPNKYAEGMLYHRKYAHLKIDNNKTPLFGSIGLDMAAQFGATTYIGDVVIDFPNSLQEFFNVFIPLAGGSDSPWIDQANVSGNHIGTYLMELGYRHPKGWQVRAYHEHIFEDHSGMTFRNNLDGLTGIEFKHSNEKSWINGAVIEYIATRDQSGPIIWDTKDPINIQVSNLDNYYDHCYLPGWVHSGYTAGTPFITSPAYRSDTGNLSIFNNRVLALHAAVTGYITPQIDYRLLGSVQRGWGTYNDPFLDTQESLSLLVEVGYCPTSLPGWYGRVSIATDGGSLLGNNQALQFTIRKEGIIPSYKVK